MSLHTIRLWSRRARELFARDYPFTSRQFRTDGRSIFASAMEEAGETELLDLARRQYAFRSSMQIDSLHDGIPPPKQTDRRGATTVYMYSSLGAELAIESNSLKVASASI